MNKEIKTVKNIILGVGILIVSTLSVHAGFGVSPTDISYENLKPGATFTKKFTLSRSEDLQEMDVTIQPDLADIDLWFTYSPGKTFKFPSGESTTTFEVTVKVPENTPYQNYDGVIRLVAVPSNQDVRGVTITQGVRLDAGLVVTETDIRSLSILSIKALASVEGEPIKLEIVGENHGNVDASPVVNVSVLDLQMNVLETHDITNFGFVKPNETGTMIAEFDTNLPSGEYFLQVDVLLDGKSLRKERLVMNINNVPTSDVTEDEQKTPNFLLGVGNFIKENRVFFLYLAIAVVIEVVIYILLQRAWLKKLGEKGKKIGSQLLGSKLTRITLSFAVGFIIFMGLLTYHYMTLEAETTEEIVIATDVQGVQDSTIKDSSIDSLLYVFPSIKVPQYLIYEQADVTSEIIYEAQEGEDFNVLDEVEDWYKVQLPDGRDGWLKKNDIKSKLTEGE